MQKLLRTLAFITVAMLVVFAIGCGSDEEELSKSTKEETPENQLVGTWELVSFSKNNGPTEVASIETFMLMLTFNANGTFTGKEWDYGPPEENFSGTYVVSGSTLTVTLDGDIITITFSISENRMTWDRTSEGAVTHQVFERQ